jgi:hypothetical protein
MKNLEMQVSSMFMARSIEEIGFRSHQVLYSALQSARHPSGTGGGAKVGGNGGAGAAILWGSQIGKEVRSRDGKDGLRKENISSTEV